jgi:hypothetical protein
LGALHVATTLHDVFRLQVEGNRAIDLLEEATKEAKMVVLPLYLA